MMGRFKKIINGFNWRNGNPDYIQGSDWQVINMSGDGWSNFTEKKESEVTYFICLKTLCEAVSKLPIHLKTDDNKKIFDSEINQILKIRPNPYMTPTDFKLLMEFNRIHYGNAYAWIETKGGKRVGLHPLDPTRVKIIIDPKNELNFGATYIYEYTTKTDKRIYFTNFEIIHLKGGITGDGIVGKSIAEELAQTIEGSQEAQKYLNELYKRGLTANAVLQYTGDLNEKKKKELVRRISDFIHDKENGNIVPIPLGMELKPLDIKLADAQFFELRKFTSLQIAAAFGVKPNHLNDYDKSSYANSETQNLSFLIDTLLVILKKWEEELDYKLLYESEIKKGFHTQFNVATILRGDLKTQAEAINLYITSGVYTINEARKYLEMPTIPGGDVNMINGTYVTLEDIGKAYEGGE